LQDCFVTDWRLKWLTELPAPAHIAVDQASSRGPLQNLSALPHFGTDAIGLALTGDRLLAQVYQPVQNLNDPSGSYKSQFASGDFDGDGDLDLAGAGYGGNTNSKVYLNNGAGSFTEYILP